MTDHRWTFASGQSALNDYLIGRHPVAEPIRALVMLTQAATFVTEAVERTVLQGLELTVAGFRIMLALAGLGPMEPHEIAEVLGLSRPSVVSSLNTLERAGMVVRTPHPTDGRRVVTELTREGAVRAGVAIGGWLALVDRLADGLTEGEKQALTRIALKVGNGARKAISEG